MSLHEFNIVVDIDDEALAEWLPQADLKGGPYTTNLDEWDTSDLTRAMDMEIVERDDCVLTYMGPAPS